MEGVVDKTQSREGLRVETKGEEVTAALIITHNGMPSVLPSRKSPCEMS